MKRQNISSGARWEPIIVLFRGGPHRRNEVRVAGTTGHRAPENPVVGAGDMYTQTVQALRNIEMALRAAAATMADVGQGDLHDRHRTVAGGGCGGTLWAS